MGNLNACCWAQGAHAGVLEQDATAFPEAVRVRPHAPFPLGLYAEAMTLDDRVGLMAVPREAEQQRCAPAALQGAASFAAAERL
eukprot:9869181-Lingulodinium_polyedra.AAC.1